MPTRTNQSLLATKPGTAALDPAAYRLPDTRGENHPRAKLSEADVRFIRADFPNHRDFDRLAVKFGVHPITIRDIVRRKTWGWVQ